MVSVVIPFFNANKYLYDTLSSVFENEEFIREVIIVQDKGSCPPIISAEFSHKTSVKVNESKYGGAGYARWLGVQQSKGDFIAFIDADDLWVSDKLPKQLDFMQRNSLDFSFMAFSHFRGDEHHDKKRPIIPKGPYTIDRFLKKSFVVPCLTVMISREVKSSVSFNTLKRRNDYFMWFQLLLKLESQNKAWAGFPEIGGYHRLHAESLTRSRIKSVIDQYVFLRKCAFGLFKTCFYMVCYLFNTLGTR